MVHTIYMIPQGYFKECWGITMVNLGQTAHKVCRRNTFLLLKSKAVFPTLWIWLMGSNVKFGKLQFIAGSADIFSAPTAVVFEKSAARSVWSINREVFKVHRSCALLIHKMVQERSQNCNQITKTEKYCVQLKSFFDSF